MTTINQRTPDDIRQNGDFDELIEAIKDTNDTLDDHQWLQGDYVLSVFDRFQGSTYGKELLKELSIATQIPEETLKVRRRMSKRYTPHHRQYIKDTFAVNYSVMHVALGAGSDIEDVIDFLDHCANKDDINSVAHYRRELALYKGTPHRAKKLARVTGRYLLDSYGEPCLLLERDELADIDLEDGQTYVIDIWEANKDEPVTRD